MDHLKHKTALITGASQGIGEAAARHLAAHGANVVLMARSGDKLRAVAASITAQGGSAVAVAGDVARYGDASAAVEAATDRFGRLDILVNNAGLIDPVARLADSDVAAWGRIVDINLKGVYHGLRAALPGMIAARSGTDATIIDAGVYSNGRLSQISSLHSRHTVWIASTSPANSSTGSAAAARRALRFPVRPERQGAAGSREDNRAPPRLHQRLSQRTPEAPQISGGIGPQTVSRERSPVTAVLPEIIRICLEFERARGRCHDVTVNPLARGIGGGGLKAGEG